MRSYSATGSFLLLLGLITPAVCAACSTTPPKPKILDVKRRVETRKVFFSAELTKHPSAEDTRVIITLTHCLEERTFKTEIREKIVDGKVSGVEEMPELVEKQTLTDRRYPLTNSSFTMVSINNNIMCEGTLENGILTFDYAGMLPRLDAACRETEAVIFCKVDGKLKKFTVSLDTRELGKINSAFSMKKKTETTPPAASKAASKPIPKAVRNIPDWEVVEYNSDEDREWTRWVKVFEDFPSLAEERMKRPFVIYFYWPDEEINENNRTEITNCARFEKDLAKALPFIKSIKKFGKYRCNAKNLSRKVRAKYFARPPRIAVFNALGSHEYGTGFIPKNGRNFALKLHLIWKESNEEVLREQNKGKR